MAPSAPLGDKAAGCIDDRRATLRLGTQPSKRQFRWHSQYAVGQHGRGAYLAMLSSAISIS